MRIRDLRKKGIRLTAGLIIAALLATDSSLVVFAADTPEDPAPIVYEEPEQEQEPEQEPAQEPEIPEQEPEIPEGETAGSTEQQDTQEPEMPEEEPQIPEEEPEIVEEEPVLYDTVVIEEAHGEPGRVLSNNFLAFSDKSRSDYYHRYYNQLEEYGQKIYSFLTENADDFIILSQKINDGTIREEDIPKLVLENDIPDSQLQSRLETAKKQVRYAYAAFDYDHPEIFWLAVNSFNFKIFSIGTGAGVSRIYIEFDHAEDENYTIYGHDLDLIETESDEMMANVNDLVAAARAETDIYDRIAVINDWLSNFNYYNRFVSRNRKSDASDKAYESVSAFIEQTWLTSSFDFGDREAPVCEAYSRAFKMVCDRIGLPCILVIGDGHMWNYVQNEDGVWYAVDTTWDDPCRDDEYVNRITPDDAIHRYILVGRDTVVPYETKTFQEDGHHPNGTYWIGGDVMPTPAISTTEYERDLGPHIDNLNVTTENGRMIITFDTDMTGKYYYIIKEDDTSVPDVYRVQNLYSTVENGSGTGRVVAAGTVTIEAANPPEGEKYDLYLIQLSDKEYISQMLTFEDFEPLAYVGWKTIGNKKYYFCPENDEDWEENIDEHGEHVNERGAMATGAKWVGDTLYKFNADGTLNKQWYRIKDLEIDPIPADAKGAVAENRLTRGSTYKLDYEYIPEVYDSHFMDLVNDDTAIVWTSDEPGTVSVDPDGTVHALKVSAGPVRITGVTGDNDNRYKPTGEIYISVTYPTGWFSVGADRFYGELDGDTVTLLEDWQDIDGRRYYFYPEGDTEHTPYSAATGFAKIDNRYYEFDADGALKQDTEVTDGFVTVDGKTFYLENGVVVTGENRLIGNHWYGFDDNGVMYKGTYFKRDISGRTWYFYADEDGVLATGSRYTDRVGNRYFADNSYAAGEGVPVGSMQQGILTIGSGAFYHSEISESAGGSGELIVNGGLRQYGYFEGDAQNAGKFYYAIPYGKVNAGMLQSGWVQADCIWRLFRSGDDATAPYAETSNGYLNGWVEVNESGNYRRYYIDPAGRNVTGWRTINGNKYYFDADGAAASGFWDISGQTYYFGENADLGNPDDDYGIMKTGRYSVVPDTYFFNTTGALQTGWQKDPVTNIWDYYDPVTGKSVGTVPDRAPNGRLSGLYWYDMTDGTDHHFYYFSNNNTRQTGFATIDGDKYWFDTADGVQSGRMATGLWTIGNNLYYFSENDADRGSMLVGLCTFVSDADGQTYTYYANANGVLQLGWQKTDGVWRYFDRRYGYETTASIGADYWSTVTDTAGVVHKYYFRNGTAMVTGRQLIDGRYYYFSENKDDGSLGRLLVNDYVRIGNNLYRAGSDGVLELVTAGWHNIGGSWKYIDANNYLKTGWQMIDGDKYYFDGEGSMQTGEFTVGVYSYRTHAGEAGYDDQAAGICYVNEWYTYHNVEDPDAQAVRMQFYDAGGYRASGWLKVSSNGMTCYSYLAPEASADGRYAVGDMYTGISTINGQKYVFDAGGLNYRSDVVELEEDRAARIPADMAGVYCTDKNGAMLTGWQKPEGEWRYFDPVTGKEKPSAVVGKFVTVGDRTYYFENANTMATGFKDIDGKRYFFLNDPKDPENYGAMAKGWFVAGVDKYYADETDGHLVSGLVTIDGKDYDFNSKFAVLTGWQTVDAQGTDRRFFDNTKDKADPLYGAQLPCEYKGNGYYEVTIGGDVCYYRFAKGNMQTGWQNIGGKYYCFGTDGRLLSGMFSYNKTWYYTSETGTVGSDLGCVVPGLVDLTVGGINRKYYFNTSGRVMTGMQTVDGNTYYFEPTEGDGFGSMVYGRFKAGTQYYYTGTDGVLQKNRFVNYCGETYYATGSGTLASGWQNLKYTEDNITRRYYFDTEGRMLTGWQTIEKDSYFFCTDPRIPEKGSLITGNMEIDGEDYSFDKNGRMQTGWQKVDDVWCYYAGTEDLARGNITEEDLGKRVYTETVIPEDYWRQVHFDSGRTRLYYIANNRNVIKGWTYIKNDAGLTIRYYFDTVTGELLTGLYKIGNSYYILPDKDQDISGFEGRRAIGGDHYFFNSKGQALTGWQQNSDGKYYYYDPADAKESHGEKIDIVGGTDVYAIKIGRYSYRLNGDGSRFNAALSEGYMTSDDGRLLSGWQTAGDDRYYFDTDDYHMYHDEARLISSNWYWFGADGHMTKGFVADPDDGYTYYYGSNGARVSGWQKIDTGSGEEKYYFDPAGGRQDPATGRMKTGFAKIGKDTYYFDANGVMQTGLCDDIGGKTFWFGTSGVLQTGWQKVGNTWYYFATAADAKRQRVDAGDVGKSCPAAVTPGTYWKTVTFDNADTASYYIKNDTTVLKNWQTIDGKKYYFDTDGELATGHFAINNVRYYADADGAVHNGFVEEADGWHYYDANGRMQTGWQMIKCTDDVTRKFHFNANGVLFVGKMSINGTYYFFDDDTSEYPGEGSQGEMMTGVVTSADGSVYFANTSGVLQTGWQKVGGNWDYYAMQEDINSGLVDTADIAKRFHHETAAPAAYWRNIVFPGGTRDYYINSNTTVYKGWQSVRNALGKSVKHYFDPRTGELWIGLKKIGTVWYELPDKDEDIMTGLQQIGGDWYYLNSSGQIQTGWQTIEGSRYYFDQSTGVMQTGLILVGSSRYYLDANGIMQTGLQTIDGHIYLFGTSGAMQTGWQTIDGGRYYFDPATGYKMVNGFVTVGSSVYYLDASGIMQTGLQTIDGHIYLFGTSGAMQTGWQTMDGSRYYFDPATGYKMANGFVTIGNSVYYLDANGIMQTGLQTVGGNRYYLGTSGVMQTGWQTVNGGRYYFDPVSGRMIIDEFVTVGGSRYYLDANGIMVTGLQNNIGGETYFFASTGVMQTGWKKTGDVWCYFATADDVNLGRVDPAKWGKSCVVTETAGTFWKKVTFDNAAECVYYINNNSSVTKGWLSLDHGNVKKKYYFNPAGELVYGHFVLNNAGYYACEDGEYPGSIYTGFMDEAGSSYYYDESGIMATGWKDIKGEGISGRYYFDIDGRMQTGVVTVSDIRYLLNSDPSLGNVGILLKGIYCELGGHKYMTDQSGVLKNGWQKFTADGDITLRYFDPDKGWEMYEIDVDPAVKWYDIDDARFCVINGAVCTGWKTVDGNSYYFDPVTGRMATGTVRINGTLYYFDKDGVRGSGLTNVGGVYYYLNSNGTMRSGWFTVGSGKYYADPSTGKLSVGFSTIGGKNYYFNEQASDIGKLVTGFFHVPYMGQSYYDADPNASNMYYALPDGTIHESGWDTIVLDPKVADSQRWSYYFAPNVVGQTREGYDITGEVATGDVLIDDNGMVTLLGNIDDFTTDVPGADPQQYYRFDRRTGARSKAVLVFLGNYYGEADYEYDERTQTVKKVTARFSPEQFDVMGSISRYINPDRLFANADDDFYIVNSNKAADQQKLYDDGLTQYDPAVTTFPMAASSHQPLTDDDKEQWVYVAGNDIATATGDSTDGHVDVYDVEKYSKDVYDRAINKFGPNNVALIGISSGGGICLALCQKAAADRQPVDTILFSPWVNLAMNRAEIESQISRKNSGFLDVDTARYWAARYTRDMSDRSLYSLPLPEDEGPGVQYTFASPLNAPNGQFAKLRNVMIYTGAYDPFSIDCKKAAEKAAGAGGDIKITCSPSMIHAYMFVRNTLSQSKETIRQACWKIMTQ